MELVGHPYAELQTSEDFKWEHSGTVGPSDPEFYKDVKSQNVSNSATERKTMLSYFQYMVHFGKYKGIPVIIASRAEKNKLGGTVTDVVAVPESNEDDDFGVLECIGEGADPGWFAAFLYKRGNGYPARKAWLLDPNSGRLSEADPGQRSCHPFGD